MQVDGLISIASAGDYAATVERLDHALAKQGITPLLRLDHAAAAATVGITLRPLLLVLFGDPRVGSLMMQRNPTAGIDLPLKILVWQSASNGVHVGYNDPAWIRARHGLGDMPGVSDKMTTILHNLALTAAFISGT